MWLTNTSKPHTVPGLVWETARIFMHGWEISSLILGRHWTSLRVFICHFEEIKKNVLKTQEANTKEVTLFSPSYILISQCFYSMFRVRWGKESVLGRRLLDFNAYWCATSRSDNPLTNLNLIDLNCKCISNIWCLLTEDPGRLIQITLKAERDQLERPGKLVSTVWGTPFVEGLSASSAYLKANRTGGLLRWGHGPRTYNVTQERSFPSP